MRKTYFPCRICCDTMKTIILFIKGTYKKYYQRNIQGGWCRKRAKPQVTVFMYDVDTLFQVGSDY